jgi:hypothetical protein
VKRVCEFGTKSDKKLGYLHCRVDGGVMQSRVKGEMVVSSEAILMDFDIAL